MIYILINTVMIQIMICDVNCLQINPALYSTIL